MNIRGGGTRPSARFWGRAGVWHKLNETYPSELSFPWVARPSARFWRRAGISLNLKKSRPALLQTSHPLSLPSLTIYNESDEWERTH
jgi:hypothetical protein